MWRKKRIMSSLVFSHFRIHFISHYPHLVICVSFCFYFLLLYSPAVVELAFLVKTVSKAGTSTRVAWTPFKNGIIKPQDGILLSNSSSSATLRFHQSTGLLWIPLCIWDPGSGASGISRELNPSLTWIWPCQLRTGNLSFWTCRMIKKNGRRAKLWIRKWSLIRES